MRTRDAGISSVRYENGLFHTAATLDEGIHIERARSMTTANGSVSLFEDGGWTLQGSLTGDAFTRSLPVTPLLAPFFKSVRGESVLALNSTAQRGLQPTVQVAGTARTHLIDVARGVWLGGTASRAFDGDLWRTTLQGETGAWFRHDAAVLTTVFRPTQLQTGDILAEHEVDASWTWRQATFSVTSGLRYGEAQRGTSAWASLSATFVALRGHLTTVSVGSYPADLMQGLPGGQFVSMSVRLPTRRPTAAVASGAPGAPRGGSAAADAAKLLFAVETPSPTAEVRVLRVRAPGARRVEVMGDFTTWDPIPLVRERTGEWVATIAIPSGSHRFNVRIDGGAWDVPANVARVTDEFNGVVGVFVIP